MRNSTETGIAFAFEKLTVGVAASGGTATLFAPATGKRARSVLLTVETDDIRVRYDGVDPTASDGHLITSGGSFRLEGCDNITRLRFIRVTADATIQVTYER
jgi:hypothetical protein